MNDLFLFLPTSLSPLPAYHCPLSCVALHSPHIFPIVISTFPLSILFHIPKNFIFLFFNVVRVMIIITRFSPNWLQRKSHNILFSKSFYMVATYQSLTQKSGKFFFMYLNLIFLNFEIWKIQVNPLLMLLALFLFAKW